MVQVEQKAQPTLKHGEARQGDARQLKANIHAMQSALL